MEVFRIIPDPSVTLIAIAIYLVQTTVPSALLVLTPKQSPIRYLWMICSAWIAYHFLLLSEGYSGSLVRYSQAGMVIFVALIHSVNLLLLNPVDRDELIKKKMIAPSDSFISSFCGSARLFFTVRGPRTPWQIKGIPPQPAFLSRKRTRWWYIVRQATFLAWQWLVLDLIYMSSLRRANTPRTPLLPGTVPVYKDWVSRISVTFIGWFIITRLLVDSMYRLASLIAVGIGGDSPDYWPPFFGSMWEAYTLRNFWGKFWHQTLRWPLTSLSKFLTRDVLNLQYPSILERYTNTMIVFLTSGILHLATDYMQGVYPHRSMSIRFFSGFTLAFMIEDAVQEIWRKLSSLTQQKPTPSKSTIDRVIPLWQRGIGFLWVMTWLSFTSPEWLLSYQDQPKETRWYVPIGTVSYIGIRSASILVMISGVFLYFAFGAVV